MIELPAISRDVHGVAHVDGDSDEALCYGFGRSHALDRGMQMLLMRILGQGRVCELLDDSDASLAIDTFFRRMNWQARDDDATGAASSDEFTPGARLMCEAYVRGVNSAFARRTPWEFRLFGYRPEPWTIDDCILLARMTGYLTLAQSQAEIERLLVEMVQAGVRRELLDELFPAPLLNELDDEADSQGQARRAHRPAGSPVDGGPAADDGVEQLGGDGLENVFRQADARERPAP